MLSKENNMYRSSVSICLSVRLFVYSFVLFYLFCSITTSLPCFWWNKDI